MRNENAPLSQGIYRLDWHLSAVGTNGTDQYQFFHNVHFSETNGRTNMIFFKNQFAGMIDKLIGILPGWELNLKEIPTRLIH